MSDEFLIGSDLFPSTIRLADGQTVTLGDLVRRAARGFAPKQWNLLDQKLRDSAMVRALDEWQREITDTGGHVRKTLEALRDIGIVPCDCPRRRKKVDSLRQRIERAKRSRP